MLLLPRLIGGYSGVMVEKFGYHDFFLITALLGVPTLLLIALHWYQETRRARANAAAAGEVNEIKEVNEATKVREEL